MPVLPRHPRLQTRQVGFVVVFQLLDVDQPDVRDGFWSVEVKEHFVNKLAAQAPVPDGDVFQFNQPLQVNADLR